MFAELIFKTAHMIMVRWSPIYCDLHVTTCMIRESANSINIKTTPSYKYLRLSVVNRSCFDKFVFIVAKTMPLQKPHHGLQRI